MPEECAENQRERDRQSKAVSFQSLRAAHEHGDN